VQLNREAFVKLFRFGSGHLHHPELLEGPGQEVFNKRILLKEDYAHSVAMFAMYYNFVRIHKTLRTTPAMAAGITSRLWEIGDIVGVLEAWENTT
jgi:hypothetical protein